MLQVALIGFGEAGQSIAGGLIAEGHCAIRAYDIGFTRADAAEHRQRAEAVGVVPCNTVADAVTGASIVVSLVVADAARQVAEFVAPVTRPEQVYLDLNSVSPMSKKAMSQIFEGNSARFVEGAVMARFGANGHRTPILTAGVAAQEATAMLNACGMRLESVGSEIGQASANKMIRSIIMKGIPALLLEALIAADRYAVTDRVLDSLDVSFPGLKWHNVASYYMGRAAVHGTRMSAEMSEVVDTLKGVGVEAVMSQAIGVRMAATGKALAGTKWGDGGPKTYKEILEALQDASDRAPDNS